MKNSSIERQDTIIQSKQDKAISVYRLAEIMITLRPRFISRRKQLLLYRRITTEVIKPNASLCKFGYVYQKEKIETRLSK